MIDYMIEMGVDPALLRLSLRYGSDDMRYLPKRDGPYRVVTADTVVSAPRSNATVVPADHC